MAAVIDGMNGLNEPLKQSELDKYDLERLHVANKVMKGGECQLLQ